VDLRSYVRLLARRWPVFVVVTVVVGALLGGASFLIPSTYTAETRLLLSPRVSPDATLDQRRTAALYIDERVRSYAALVTTPAVLDGIDGPTDLADDVTVEVPAGTTVLSVRVVSDSAQGAATIAQAIAAAMPGAVARAEGVDSAAASPVDVVVVEPAVEPEQRTSPNYRLNLVVALLLALVVGVFMAVLADTFDRRVRRASDVTALGIPYAGGLRVVRADHTRELLALGRQDKDVADVYRRIALDTLFAAGVTPATLTFTSVTGGAGKTVLAANVAAALADAGNRVVYIDADLRGGNLATQVRVPSTRGLTDVLSGRRGVDEVITTWPTGGFALIPAGGVPVNTREALSGDAMASLLARLEDDFDVIVVDGPTVTDVEEAARLARHLPDIVVVAEAGRTRRGDLARGVAALRQAGARVLGVVLSRTSRGDEGAAPGEAAAPEEME